MSIPLTINGQVFEYPQNFDEDWGIDATGWAQAVTSGALYLSGGNFPLTNTVDFGSSFGLKAKSLTSKTANPASTGYLQLAKADTIAFRNNANSANLLLAIDGSDMLTFNGSVLGLTSLTNGDIFVGNASNVPVAVTMSGDATIVSSGALTIASGAITDAKIASGAAIDVNKLAALTSSRAVVTDGSGYLTVSSTTVTEIGYVSGVTSSIQSQINAIAAVTVPSGVMVDFGGMAAPTGWLLCDGSAVSRTTYANLFAAIGTAWGVGDGSTTFNLPNMTRRVGMGSGGTGTSVIGNTVGNTGGAEHDTTTTHTHTENSHTHTMSHRHTIPIGYETSSTGALPQGADWGQGSETITAAGISWGATNFGSQPLAYAKSRLNDTANTGTQSDTGMSSNTANTSTIQPAAIVLKIIKT